MQDNQSKLIAACGLWARTNAAGQTYIAGRLGRLRVEERHRGAFPTPRAEGVRSTVREMVEGVLAALADCGTPLRAVAGGGEPWDTPR